jgi:tetratricopeptide (TPR) repeat protein
MNASLNTAIQFQRKGRYADAARLYHDLLRREPDHPDALHLFGVMHHECGHSGRAAELIGRALMLRPGAAAFHANLSEVLRAIGDHAASAESAREALRLQPDFPEASNNLGLALLEMGRFDDAVDAFREALRRRPSFALALNNLGTALKEMDLDDQAFEAFQRAVELDPDSAMAHANLGQMLVDRDRPEEGLEHCRTAARLGPNLVAAHNNLGNAYRVLGRFAESNVAYAEALRLSPGIAGARAHANIGRALHADGQVQRGLACLRRAVEIAPDDVEVWRGLAETYADAENYADAIPCCRRIVEFEPERAQAHNNLGWALQQEGYVEEAADRYRRALEIRPDHIDAALNLANLNEELGELAEAEAAYRRLFEATGNPIPLARLATLLRGRLPDSELDALRSRIDDPEIVDDTRSSLLFGLAHVRDARGEYAEAAKAMREANALALTRRVRRNRAYDPVEHTGFVDRLLEGFTPEFFRRLADSGDPTCQPVFILGLPRSGTTLTEQVLAGHPRVHGAGELRLARQSFESIPEVVGRHDGFVSCLSALDGANLRTLAERHLEELRKIASRASGGADADRIVNKMPDNYLHLGLLALMFPRATFIHVRRDVRDIALSCWITAFRSIRWANDVNHIASRIKEHRRLMDHWRAVLPVPLHEILYEDLVNDLEGESRRLVEACGLEWDPVCLEFHRIERPIRTASVTQVRQPLYRRSLARWRWYETELADLFDQLPVE